MNSVIVSLEAKNHLLQKVRQFMSARIEFRKCTICHGAFSWNGISRCICNGCKKQNVSKSAVKRNNNESFITISHANGMKAIA